MNIELVDYIYNFYLQCEHYKYLMTMCSNEYDKKYYKNLIKDTMNKVSQAIEKDKKEDPRQIYKFLTLEELSEYDGTNGKPAYVAIDGLIYNVTGSQTWGTGSHFGLYPGKDLSREFESCHVTKDVLEKYSQVAILKKK